MTVEANVRQGEADQLVFSGKAENIAWARQERSAVCRPRVTQEHAPAITDPFGFPDSYAAQPAR